MSDIKCEAERKHHTESEYLVEIAHLRAECEKRGSTILDLLVQVNTARNDTLEQAAMAGYVACATTGHVTLGNKVKAAIRALKEPKP